MTRKLIMMFLVVWMLLLTISQSFLANAFANITILQFKQESDIVIMKQWQREHTVTHAPVIKAMPSTPGMPNDPEHNPVFED